MTKILDFFIWVKGNIPTWVEIKQGTHIFLMIVGGGLLLAPLVARLPILGWDWYYFFTAHNPDYNLYSKASAYPPFAKYAIEIFSWIPHWRQSLAILNSISLVTVAIATWRAGGKIVSVVLSLFNGVILIQLWAGHVDLLALMGYVTGFVPLALIKPQIVGWSLLSNRKLFFWTVIFLFLTLIFWPMWPLRMLNATFTHEAAVGWKVTGWLAPVLGLFFLIGAGNHPWQLMAAGCMISPYLMPYQLAVLTPSVGAASGWKKGAIWFSSWIVPIGLGLGGNYKYLYFIFPLVVYLSLVSKEEYIINASQFISLVSLFFRKAIDPLVRPPPQD